MRVEVRSSAGPVDGAIVTIDGAAGARTGPDGGIATVVRPGKVTVSVVKEGFFPAKASLVVEPGRESIIRVDLEPQTEVEEQVKVFATRNDVRIQDSPLHVEVLVREEIEEKMMMTPGDIVMLLNEMGGMRVQTTSPSLGAASVRVQGMLGRYTSFLSDGLPLFGQQGAGLGLLQIPPMDLGQVEVIKGNASALYGGSAMAGVVNLISRRPKKEAIREFLLNQTTLGGTDASLFLAAPLSKQWSASLLGSGDWQRRRDVNGDGWADLAGYTRGVVRPRFYWDDGNGRTALLTGGGTYEERSGGTMPGSTLAATGQPYTEGLNTRRYDAGGNLQWLVAKRYVVSSRFSISEQQHRHQFGELQEANRNRLGDRPMARGTLDADPVVRGSSEACAGPDGPLMKQKLDFAAPSGSVAQASSLEDDRHELFFGEMSVRGAAGSNTWVVGAAAQRDAFRPKQLQRFAYTYVVPGVFVQDDLTVTPWLSVSASARADFHSQYGAFLSPRLSALLRRPGWTSRLSVGQGFFAPTPLTEETEAAGLTRLSLPRPLVAERGRSASFDLTRSMGPLAVTGTLFLSNIGHPVYVDRGDAYRILNLQAPRKNRGAEILATWRKSPFSATASYSYVRASEVAPGLAGRTDVPLTPKHSFGLVGMWEKEGVARFGVECYYTGEQRLEHNPYRDLSRPYVIVGAMGERKIAAHVKLFINLENLANVRQTRWDPLILPARGADGRWTVDAWAPLDGRVVNGGLRFYF